MIIKKRYFSWCFLLIMVAASAVTIAQDQSNEDGLIAVLKSDAPKSEKAITCKRLAVYGTEKAVPALAPLLADEELTSWARIALEAIPGPAADTALRDALGKLQGRVLVGVINSIGVRRDALAVEPLIQKLKDTDASVASAAAVALGHIGGDQVAKALTQSLSDKRADVRSSVAMGCVLCAENFLKADKQAEAVKLYDAVRQADVPDQRHLEGIRGAILARGSAGTPLLIEQLQSKDKKRLGIGLRTARELSGRDVTEALAAELSKLSPERQPLLLLAISDRHDDAVLPAVVKAVQADNKNLRITAISILIELGDVSSVPVLLKAATENDAELEKAATETLIRLPGKDVDADLLGRLPESKGKLRKLLIDVAGQRQIAQALPAVVSSLRDSDADVRTSAVNTIAIIGQADQAGDLVKLLQETGNASERDNIGKTLLTLCGEYGVKCVPHLQPLMKSSDNELQMIGLHALAITGGPDALGTVLSAVKSAAGPVQDEAVRVLSTWPNNWPDDAEAGKALLALATSAEKMPHKVLGLRGYLQYVRGNKALDNGQKTAEIKDLLSHIERLEEKRQAIAALGDAPCSDALELLNSLAENPSLVEEAYSAMVNVASKDIAGVSKDQRKQVLQTVVDKTKNNRTKQRAQKALGEIR